MQLGFYFDQAKCVGCYACSLACRLEHDLPPDVHWRRILWINSDEPVAFISMPCLHCAQPPCIDACPAGAITKREEDGIVLVDGAMCLGKDSCGEMCKEACPYDVPQFSSESNANMTKCNFCFDRLEEGKKPTCVITCCHQALDWGPLDELVAKYGDSRLARGFIYSREALPSLVVRGGK